MTDNGYGLWFLVAFNSLLFIFFAASFFHPQSKRDWRALGGFSAFIGGGFWLIATGWKHLFEAQKAQLLATTGPYAHVRHPQYSGFVLIMVGFSLQRPTFATLLILSVLLLVYRRLAIREERDVAAEFGAAWEAYVEELPRFVPRPRQLRHPDTAAQHQAKPATEAKAAFPAAQVAGGGTWGRRA